MYEIGKCVAIKFNKQWYSGKQWIPPTMKLRLDVWELSAKTNLHGQKGMMFAGTKIVILSAALSHQLLFLREHLDCVKKTLKK